MTIKKLSAMPYAQAHIEIDEDGNISLFSYVTKVAEIDADGFVSCFGLYGRTTRKHISAFIKEYAQPLDYYDIKQAYEGGYKVSHITGEITDITE